MTSPTFRKILGWGAAVGLLFSVWATIHTKFLLVLPAMFILGVLLTLGLIVVLDYFLESGTKVIGRHSKPMCPTCQKKGLEYGVTCVTTYQEVWDADPTNKAEDYYRGIPTDECMCTNGHIFSYDRAFVRSTLLNA